MSRRARPPIWYNKTKSIAKSYRAMLKKNEHTEREKQEMEAIAGALQWIGEQPDGVSKAAAMRGTYIDGKPLYLAAEAAGYTLSGIKRTHRRFLTKIAENLGYL